MKTRKIYTIMVRKKELDYCTINGEPARTWNSSHFDIYPTKQSAISFADFLIRKYDINDYTFHVRIEVVSHDLTTSGTENSKVIYVVEKK